MDKKFAGRMTAIITKISVLLKNMQVGYYGRKNKIHIFRARIILL